MQTWNSRRAELHRAWMEVLGPMPRVASAPPEVEVLTTETQTDHVRHLVRYRTEPDDVAYAFLLVPRSMSGPAPGAVVFHGTSNSHIYQPAGLADAPTRHLGLQLVRRGYVVIAPRCFIFAGDGDTLTTTARSADDWAQATARVKQRDSRRTGMGKMLWDGMRAVDVLISRPDVDASRVIAIGHSLGAKEALYLTAFDEQICAAVASEGGAGLLLSNWDAPWYLGSQVKQPGFARDHHELLALVAPRSIMVIGGESADGEKSRPWIDAARPVFALFDRPDHLTIRIHHAGHDFPQEEFDAAVNWLGQRLAERQ